MEQVVQIRVGYELVYDCPQVTPMILMLNIHFSHASDIIVPDRVVTEPSLPVTAYRDSFGNWCSRIVAPAGETCISTDALVNGTADLVAPEATQTPVDVSDETFAELRGHYSEPQIVELTFAVAIENFFNRVNAPLGVEAEGFCAIPDLSYRGDAEAQRQSA